MRGLPGGTYALRYATPDAYDMKLPDRRIANGEGLTASIPRGGVFTLYTKQVKILKPLLRGNIFGFSIATIAPNAQITIQRSLDPTVPNSWVPVGNLVMSGLQRDWSEPLDANWPQGFYRLVCR